jgi:hypothetical protein
MAIPDPLSARLAMRQEVIDEGYPITPEIIAPIFLHTGLSILIVLSATTCISTKSHNRLPRHSGSQLHSQRV